MEETRNYSISENFEIELVENIIKLLLKYSSTLLISSRKYTKDRFGWIPRHFRLENYLQQQKPSRNKRRKKARSTFDVILPHWNVYKSQQITYQNATEEFNSLNLAMAHCRNVRALGRVSYIDQIENLNIKTEMLMNEKLPDQV